MNNELDSITISQDDDEISLLDLLAVVLRYKKLIIGFTVAAAIGVVLFSVISLVLPQEKTYLPNKFTAKSYMLINETSSSSTLSNMLNSSGLNSLAGLAGISPTSSTNSDLAKFLVGSNEFLDKIITKFNLVSIYEIKKDPITNSRKKLKKVLKADSDKTATNVFSIECTDIDRVLAQNIVNYATSLLEERFKSIGIDKNMSEKENLEKSLASSEEQVLKLSDELQKLEYGVASNSQGIPRVTIEAERLSREIEIQMTIYKQLRQQYELVKISMASETPIFQILEYAELPETKSGPSRGMLCIIVTFAAFFLSIFLAFALNAADNIKKDPEAMKKLQAGKK